MLVLDFLDECGPRIANTVALLLELGKWYFLRLCSIEEGENVVCVLDFGLIGGDGDDLIFADFILDDPFLEESYVFSERAFCERLYFDRLFSHLIY